MQFESYRWRQLWDGLLALVMAYAAVEIPLRFELTYTPSWQLLVLDSVFIAIMWCDLGLNWLWPLPQPRQGRAVPAGHWQARRGFWLCVDVLAALPLKFFLAASGISLLHLIKLLSVAQRMARWRQHEVRHANFLRLLFFAYWLLLAAHCLAWGWLVLDGATRFASETAPPQDGTTEYLRALYWSVTTLATVGYGDLTPTTNPQLVYTMAVMLLGVGVYGYVIGNVTRLLANIDLAKSHYRENMERLGAFMHYRHIPLPLQRRLQDYYAYLWENRLGGYGESTVLADLPESLRAEVAIFLRRDFIERAPLFKGASPEFVRDLTLQLRPVVYTPGDYIFRYGQEGQEMYFISRGAVEIVAGDGETVLNTLNDGDFFGELALLLRQPRTASVRAVDYCDLYVLGKTTFDRVVARYPAFAAHIQEEADKRQPAASLSPPLTSSLPVRSPTD